jgi:hypothetical protein
MSSFWLVVNGKVERGRLDDARHRTTMFPAEGLH